MAQTDSLALDSVGELTQVITLDGECDGSTAAEAQERIRAALDSGRTQIIFDLRGVSSVAPSMLYMLSRGAIEAKARNGSLAIVRPNERVWALFEDGGLGRVFPTFPALSDAVAKKRRP
jgi:anti-anti-sigma factor